MNTPSARRRLPIRTTSTPETGAAGTKSAASGNRSCTPIDRYVRGLTEVEIGGVLNPIFCSELDPTDPTGQTCAKPFRSRDNVFLGAIVGVPWQDIAKDPHDLQQGYRATGEYGLTASELEAEGADVPGGVDADTTLWDVLIGPTYENHALVMSDEAVDPLMRESVEPREGTNPALGVPLARPEETTAWANPINGHEWNPRADRELQYSCIFDLPEPFECTANEPCDCKSTSDRNNPLCQDDSGQYTTTQRRAKAFPGRRQLAVLKGIGDQGIAASICPATMDANEPHFGYRPAVSAIVQRLALALSGTCWDEELEPDEDGSVQCVVFEATRGEVDEDGNVTCECDGIRSDPSAASFEAVEADETYKLNKMNCVCEVAQASAETGALRACIEQTEVSPQHEGWCYLDPDIDDKANAGVMGSCHRMIRFVSEPRADSLTFIQCRGASI